MRNNAKQEFKDFYTEVIVTHCLTNYCHECTGSYVNEPLRYRLMCECPCHKNESGTAK